MNYCEMCGAETEENAVLCPKCEFLLLTHKKLKPKKGVKKKVKLIIMIISYIALFVFLILFFLVSSSCFRTNDLRCYNLSLIVLIIFSCFCFIAAVLVGEEEMPQQPSNA